MTARRRNATPEADFQRTLVQWLRAVLPMGAIIHHSASEQKEKTRQAILVGMGVYPGFSDLLVLSGGKILFLECKSKAGRQSFAQTRFQALVEAQGFPYAIVRTLDDALGALRDAGFYLRLKGGRA